MSRLVVSLLVGFVLGLGAIRSRRRKARLVERLNFAHEFCQKLQAFVASNGRNVESYVWLTQRAVRMQEQLGLFGIMAQYKPAGANYSITNYPMVVNLLPEIRDSFVSDMAFLAPTVVRGQINGIQDTIVRYSGVLEDLINDAEQETRNPFVWFREGVRAILLAPIYALKWFGVLPESVTLGVAESGIFRIVSALFVAFTALSALVSLVTGWTAFLGILQQTFKF